MSSSIGTNDSKQPVFIKRDFEKKLYTTYGKDTVLVGNELNSILLVRAITNRVATIASYEDNALLATKHKDHQFQSIHPALYDPLSATQHLQLTQQMNYPQHGAFSIIDNHTNCKYGPFK